MSQPLDPIIRPNPNDDDIDAPPSPAEPTATRRIASTDRGDKDDDRMTTSQITSASAVTSLPAAGTTSAAIATSSVNRGGQNPATPQSSTVRSTSISSAQPPTATSSSTSSATSTANSATPVKPSTTSTLSSSSSKPTTTSSSTTSSSSSTSKASSSTSSASVSKSISSASSSATKAAAENGKSGIGGTGLSIGALVGIIIGGVVALVLIGIVATRTIRQKQRRDRAKRRSSMFEWPANTVDDEPYEKPRYEPPSQSYAMSDAYNTNSNSNNGNSGTVSYLTNETAYAPLPTQQHQQQNYMERNNPQYSYGNNNNNQPSYPPQQQRYPQYQENIVPPPGIQSNTTGSSGGASDGLRDGTMVRVQVGFVRSLEDELAITPGQQLYLHQLYDDGWCLCEDSNQFKGVVPISCLQPLTQSLAPNMTREGSGGSGERLQRRSSLYREQ